MTAPAPIKRRFIKVGNRQVHYRRSGTGSPVVLIHPGIAHSAYLTPQINRLSVNYTCFAFDNPGYGNSDPLPGDHVSMADIAEALAATLRVIKFPKAPVFGTHTGAAIALELAVRHPDLVSGILIDGLPMFTPEETRALFSEDYAAPLILDRLGGHFTSTWTRLRDQATFYPWYSRDPKDLLPIEVAASPESIHNSLSYFFCAAKNYQGPFLSAHTFGEIAVERLNSLTVPGVFMLSSNDNLIKHFDRYPPLKPTQKLVRLGPTAEEKNALIDTYLREYDSKQSPPPDASPSQSSLAIDKRFVDLADSQVLVRSCGAETAPPLILLHDAPGSGLALEPLICALALQHRVYALDLPGCGESGPLPSETPSMSDYAQAVADVCRELTANPAAVYGIGFGSSVAIELARGHASEVSRLILRGVLLPTPEERADLRANYAPPITIESTGGHWYRTWLMLRDSLIYWPWYNRTGAGLRRLRADFGAERLHDWTFEVMKQRHAYHHPINAALNHHADKALKNVEHPILILHDENHPFAGYDRALVDLTPAAARAPLAHSVYEEADSIEKFLSA